MSTTLIGAIKYLPVRQVHRSRILWARLDHYEDSLKDFCREILPSSLFVGPPVEIGTIDDFL